MDFNDLNAFEIVFIVLQVRRSAVSDCRNQSCWPLGMIQDAAKTSVRFLVSAHVGMFIYLFIYLFIFAMKRCPIEAKIAGSIGILPCCVLNDF